MPRRVWLDWTHGRRYQGGSGSYRTDGPALHHHEHGHSEEAVHVHEVEGQ